jgi:hypothetical protein
MAKIRISLVIFIFTAAILSILGGCSETFSPPPEFANIITGGGGGGGADPIVPGSGGRKVSEITAENADFARYNDKPGAPGMRIAALTQLESVGDDITTQDTLGLWGDNKFHIEGAGSSFNGTFANAGFTDALIFYYDQLMPGEFKISARIRIRRAGGVSTGKGINVGACINKDKDLVSGGIIDGIPQWKQGQGSKGMGLFFRAESMPQFRIYYSDKGASTTAGQNAVLTPELLDLKLTKEYIYEVARVKIDPSKGEDEIISFQDGGTATAPVMKESKNLMYTYKLLDSKTCSPVVWRSGTGLEGSKSYPIQLPIAAANYFPYVSGDSNQMLISGTKTTGIPVDSDRHPVGGTQVEMADALRGDVYPGISITGCVAEISQIKVWTSTQHGGNGMDWNYGDGNTPGSGDQPIFKTPDTIPAYVPVNKFDMIVLPSKISVVENGMNVFRWSAGSSGANWGGLSVAAYKIAIKTIVTPSYADENIYYQLFPIGTPHAAFLDSNGNVTIRGGSLVTTLQGDELVDDGGIISGIQEAGGERAYKVWIISFDKTKMNFGETANARFVLVARNLNLDVDDEIKNAPDYSLLQTLPEYHFTVEMTRPPEGSYWD